MWKLAVFSALYKSFGCIALLHYFGYIKSRIIFLKKIDSQSHDVNKFIFSIHFDLQNMQRKVRLINKFYIKLLRNRRRFNELVNQLIGELIKWVMNNLT